MSDCLKVTFQYNKQNEEAFKRRILLYWLMLRYVSTDSVIKDIFEKYDEKEIVKSRAFLEREFIAQIDDVWMYDSLTKIYEQEKCHYTENEKNVLIKLAKTTSDILEKESELEIKVSNTLKEVEKKHPIATKIIAIVLSGIVASLIDSSVQGVLTSYIQSQNVDMGESHYKDVNHSSLYINESDISDVD